MYRATLAAPSLPQWNRALYLFAPMVLALFAILVAGLEDPAFAQGPGRPDAVPFCGLSSPLNTRSRPRLLPRDEVARDPGFLAFRRQLERAVARRDRAAILRIAEPDINIDFEGYGIEFLETF